MPWLETNRVNERLKFVEAHAAGLYSMTELCVRFGVSRPTGYEWVARFAAEGVCGLEDRSHAPHRCPHSMPDSMQDLVVAERDRHPTWGSAKLRARLMEDHPQLDIPARSRIDQLLRSRGKLRVRRRGPSGGEHPGSKPLVANQPNDVWTIDFKGEFRVRDGSLCFPLTVQDANTRFLPGCSILESTAAAPAMAALERMYREYGVPLGMRSDNGGPFVANTALRGLGRLGIWWIQLGIRHERTRPGRPQDNARHERMHRTLKAETARPPEATLAAQQLRTDAFRAEYNHLRPHEALGQKTPASLYQPSPRPFPTRLREPDYAGHFEKRLVGRNGTITFRGHPVFVGTPLIGHWMGLEEIDEGVWSIYFHDVLVARWSAQTLQVSG